MLRILFLCRFLASSEYAFAEGDPIGENSARYGVRTSVWQ
jgi:hypothetical protein